MALGIHIPHPMLPFWNPLDTGMGMSGMEMHSVRIVGFGGG
jgi:hypothetical protein